MAVRPWLQVLPPIMMTLLNPPSCLADPQEAIPAILLTVINLPVNQANTKEELSVACSDYALEREGRYICTEDGITCLAGWRNENSWCQEPVCGQKCKKPNGICHAPDECLCEIGFYGDECEYCTPLPGCMNGNCSKPFSCDCLEGWSGHLCDQPLCGKDCHHGYCTHPSGECHCYNGWSGSSCDVCLPLPGCDADHGYCVDPMDCKCDPSWTGTFCHIPSCPDMCETHGHGRCQDGMCKCNIGWLGEDCSECVPYPGCHQGTCSNPWECNCREGWTGHLCNITNVSKKGDDAKDTAISEEEDDAKDTTISEKEDDAKDTAISEKENDAKNTATSPNYVLSITIQPTATPNHATTHSINAATGNKEDLANISSILTTNPLQELTTKATGKESSTSGPKMTSATAIPDTHSIENISPNAPSASLNDGQNFVDPLFDNQPILEAGEGSADRILNLWTPDVKSGATSTTTEEGPKNTFITSPTLIERLDNLRNETGISEPVEQLQLITNGQTIARDHKNDRKNSVERRRNRNKRRHKREIASFETNLDETMSAASIEQYDNNDEIVRNSKILSEKYEKNEENFPLNANTGELMHDNPLFFPIKISGKRKVDEPKLTNNRRYVSNSKWYPLISDLEKVKDLSRPNVKLLTPSPKIYDEFPELNQKIDSTAEHKSYE